MDNKYLIEFKKYSIEFHNFGDKDFDCPHHKVEGKYFVCISDAYQTYCSAQDTGFDKKLVSNKEWGNPENLRFLRSKIISKFNSFDDESLFKMIEEIYKSLKVI